MFKMRINLDNTDRKILYELDLNARIPLTQLAKKLKIGREMAQYRVTQLQRNGIIRKFVTMGNPTKFGYCIYKLYFKFQNMTPEKFKEILQWLINNNFVYWVASCKGRWDLNITVFARTINHFDETISPFYEKYGEYILDQEFNTTLQVGIMSKDWLLSEKKAASKVTFFGGEYEDIGIDKTEIELLRTIANNGRMSALQIAKKMNTTARIILYRLKELEKKEVILGHTTSLDLELLQKQFFKAMIYFNKFNRFIRDKIIQYCKQKPQIGFFIFCVGSWPVEIELIVDNNKQFYDIMDDMQAHFPEMKKYDFVIMPQEYKFDWIPQCYQAES